jgi:hypothetical protein
MNSDDYKRLETEIDRELKNLPELSAPVTLLARVMSGIGQQSALPWYRRSWQGWPMPLQAASLAVMLALFGGLCYGSWLFAQSPGASHATQSISGWFSEAGSAWNTLNVLGGAMSLVIKKLGTGFIVAALSVAVMSYFACIGFGTAMVRFALARR